MNTYRYEGMSASGARVQGVVEAFDQHDAVARAKASCPVVLRVTQEKKSSEKNIFNTDLAELFGGVKIKDKELSLLCSQLAIELKAGLPLVRSLQLVADNATDKNLRDILVQVTQDVQSGHGLADSFALRGPMLPTTFIETIRAGEESGRLDECFQRLDVYYQSAAQVRSKVGSAMIYPILLIVVAVVVIAVIMLKAVPVFKDSFAQMGSELPGVTKALIALSDFVTHYIWVIVAVVVAVFAAAKLFGRTDKGKALYARIALTFPGIGLVNRMNAATQFASTMATMLASGLPMVQAVRITGNVTGNYLIRNDILAAADGITTGRRLGDCLKECPWLPPLLLEMTSVGEETGSLEETLDVINTYYTQEVNTAVSRALGILEPCIVLVLAAMVVFILLSVYLPLFSMYGSI